MPKMRQKVFCQITQYLLENHEMWKKIIAKKEEEVAPSQTKPNKSSEPILAIHEEEEETIGKDTPMEDQEEENTARGEQCRAEEQRCEASVGAEETE